MKHVGPPCCGTCSTKFQSCRTDVTCCVECHFSLEENFAFPYLPAAVRHRLRREHQRLKAAGMPHDAVMEHSMREEDWFRTYCPPEIYEQICRDHDEYAAGRLPRRDG